MANRRFRQICKAVLMTISHSDILVGIRNGKGLIDAYIIPENDYDTFRREYGDRMIDWITTPKEVNTTYGEDCKWKSS